MKVDIYIIFYSNQNKKNKKKVRRGYLRWTRATIFVYFISGFAGRTRFPFGLGVTEGSWYFIKNWKTWAVSMAYDWGALNGSSAWSYMYVYRLMQYYAGDSGIHVVIGKMEDSACGVTAAAVVVGWYKIYIQMRRWKQQHIHVCVKHKSTCFGLYSSPHRSSIDTRFFVACLVTGEISGKFELD